MTITEMKESVCVSWQIVKLANNPTKSGSYSKENYSKGKRYLSKFSSFLMVMRSF